MGKNLTDEEISKALNGTFLGGMFDYINRWKVDVESIEVRPSPELQEVADIFYSLGLAKGRKEGMEEGARVVERRGREVKGAVDPKVTADAIRQAAQGGEDEDKGKTTLTVAKVVEVTAQTADRAQGGKRCTWVYPHDMEQQDGFKFCPYCGKPIHVK